jgi:hypothetical protein
LETIKDAVTCKAVFTSDFHTAAGLQPFHLDLNNFILKDNKIAFISYVASRNEEATQLLDFYNKFHVWLQDKDPTEYTNLANENYYAHGEGQNIAKRFKEYTASSK